MKLSKELETMHDMLVYVWQSGNIDAEALDALMVQLNKIDDSVLPTRRDDESDGQAHVLGAKLRRLAIDAFELCAANGWGRDWESVGCYLHLEVSEYTEAKRGKGDSDDHISEAADVLFVLLSSLIEDSVGPRRLVDALEAKVEALKNATPPTGEHTEAIRKAIHKARE